MGLRVFYELFLCICAHLVRVQTAHERKQTHSLSAELLLVVRLFKPTGLALLSLAFVVFVHDGTD
jgi:hypothetical protein